MKYRATQPFIAFGRTPQAGDVIELTEAQAEAISDLIVEYETKILPKPENKAKKKPTRSASSQAAPASQKKTAKRSKKPAKK